MPSPAARLAATLPLAALLALLGPLPCRADDNADRLEKLERQQQETADAIAAWHDRQGKIDTAEQDQGILARELSRLRDLLVLPETPELKGAYGLGPAASKVYAVERGLSLGGYGEASFSAPLGDSDRDSARFDLMRFVLYTGYKFNDWVLINSEIEVEHATTATTQSGGGAVEVEFAHLDFLLDPRVNVRAGLVLLPMGFVNELHEPPFFHGNIRPILETELLPSTWRANGFGLFGELVPGLEYRTYGVTSLDAKLYRPEGVRLAKPDGGLDRADDWSWVLRLDYTRTPGLLAGGSLFLGDQGQAQAYGNDIDGYYRADVFTQIYEAHAQFRRRGLELRALGAAILIDDAALLSRDPEVTGANPSLPDAPVPGISQVLWGAYGEVAYDVLPLILPMTAQYLAPWGRYSWIDPQADLPAGVRADRSLARHVIDVGITYKPAPQIVLKLDARLESASRGSAPDEIHIGGGFVF